MIMTAALEVGQVSRYTMELGKLVSSGYEIFDDSWTTFVEMHKKELCNKIIRHYFFCEIGQETPDRFKHYLNEHLARIMPYYNQLYKSELLEIIPLYNHFLETNYKDLRELGFTGVSASRNDVDSIRNMYNSLRCV